MKVALTLICKNEANWLRKMLPGILGEFYGKFAVDTGSTDATIKVLNEFGFSITRRKWENDFSGPKNQSIRDAELSGADWALHLNCDETMFVDDIRSLKRRAEALPQIAWFLPTYNLSSPTAGYWFKRAYPDYHLRFWKLGLGLKFFRKVHEEVSFTGTSLFNSSESGKSEEHIYHYGFCRPAHELQSHSDMYSAIQGVGPARFATGPDIMNPLCDPPWTGRTPVSIGSN